MPRDESAKGVLLDAGPDYWQMTCRGRYGGGELLARLAEVLPPGLTLYIEGTSIAPIVAAYFEDRPAPQPVPLATSIIWPRPKVYHMPMTPENVSGLVELMNNLAAPQVADHVHAYRSLTAYLIWYNAWFDSPLYLRKDVPEGSGAPAVQHARLRVLVVPGMTRRWAVNRPNPLRPLSVLRASGYDAGRRWLLDPAATASARTWNTREPTNPRPTARGTGDVGRLAQLVRALA